MAATPDAAALNRLRPGPAHDAVKPAAWGRLLLPSFSDCLFLAVIAWLFATGTGGWSGLLADGDTGWHIRTGEWILDHGRVPREDLFSFSKQGEPWFAWEWLTDVVYAILHRHSGLKGLLLWSAFLIAAFGTVLFRHMIWRGATPFAALLVALLVFGASSIHFLARPHVFTLLALAAGLWVIEWDRRRPSPWLWMLAPFSILWVNMHGGFFAWLACLGLLVVAVAVEAALARWLDGAAWRWFALRRYALLALLCAAASLVNPYGLQLHRHVAAYLQSDWIKDNIQEFLSPVFRSESSRQFEVMLFAALIAAAGLLARRRIFPVLLILFWAHAALTSVRHVPLFLIVAAPYVAEWLTEAWRRFIEPAPPSTVRGVFAALARDMTPACARSSLWIALAAVALALAPDAWIRWPKDFPEQKFPVRLVARHGDLLAASRTFTMDQWADYLIYRQYPQQKIFVDGRSDFFGKEIGEQYIRMVQGDWRWEQLLQSHRFDAVLCPVGWPLASLLKLHPHWRIVEDDGQAILFVPVHPYQNGASSPSGQPGASSGTKPHPPSNEKTRTGRSE